MTDYTATIAAELRLKQAQVTTVARLLQEGATVPFIARYRKEATDTLDELQITAIRDSIARLADLDKRRQAITASLDERQLLTAALRQQLAKATTLAELEDIYLPHRPKRRTRAQIARENGLEQLAWFLLRQERSDPARAAVKYINRSKNVHTPDDALAGARDILAEHFSDSLSVRQLLRQLFQRHATIASTVAKGKKQDGQKFRDWFAWEEPAHRAPSHRILAIFRGEAEGILRVTIRPPQDQALHQLRRHLIKTRFQTANQVDMALVDAYKRLLAPSLENAFKTTLKQRADTEAIRVFSQNVRDLLMASPLGQVPVLAIDPGFRSGCKVVCLGAQGDLITHTVIYPHETSRQKQAADQVSQLVQRHKIRAIAIGNGTAGRETEQFIRTLKLPDKPHIVMVNESGASIYSASAVAREEFPDHDLTVRGAVSIGRRLMDPLAELVKLDPQSIGVGQYQHDVDQNQLAQALNDIVISCVNAVGVDLNTASRQLLTHVSGLGPTLAANIVTWRQENGPFTTRTELKKVPRLGPKAYEQAAGFLRIPGARNPLDTSAVHPERYDLVRRMARDQQATIPELMASDDLRQRIQLAHYVDGDLGMPTLTDILAELGKPGRDPRSSFDVFAFDESVHKPEDLTPGMRLPGIVTNVTRFGAFVDIGVHQDGLIHISQLADHYVSDPADIVHVQQQLVVTVMDVDLDRKRISLSLKAQPHSH